MSRESNAREEVMLDEVGTDLDEDTMWREKQGMHRTSTVHRKKDVCVEDDLYLLGDTETFEMVHANNSNAIESCAEGCDEFVLVEDGPRKVSWGVKRRLLCAWTRNERDT